MLFSNSRLRRYTPPTCTLEIWGKRSRLPWPSSNRLVDFKFKLIFDDPKILDNEQIILEGDRHELQLLCDRVSTYVQNLLASSASRLSLISEKGVIPYSSVTSTLISLNGKEKENSRSSQPISSKTLDYPETTHLSVTAIPSLTPKGLLTHELDCSLLITNQNKSKIVLSISQLYDLANALEEYSLEAEVSPNFDNRKPPKKIVVWSITALAALVAVGIPTVGLRWYRSLNPETAVEPSPSSGSTIKDILPPVPVPPAGPVPSPTLAPSLQQQKKLLPPSQLGQVTPPPRNSTVAVVVPPNAPLPPAPVVPAAPARNTIVLTPNLPSNAPTPPSLSTLPAPPRPNSPPPLSNTPSKSANTAYVMPSPTAVPTLPTLPTLQSSPATVPPQSQPQLAASAINTNKFNQKDNTALLDTIPQVTEVRNYFQERWQPPESLKHTLEYRLVLNPDGSIGQIVPLGKAARIYLDRTNMPLLGEPFVSAPLESLEKPQIRVVLSPDKTVKTFLE